MGRSSEPLTECTRCRVLEDIPEDQHIVVLYRKAMLCRTCWHAFREWMQSTVKIRLSRDTSKGDRECG